MSDTLESNDQNRIMIRREVNAELLVPIVNLAYRSPPNFANSWTGEGHLMRGPRVTVDELKAELNTEGVYVFAAFDNNGVICGSPRQNRLFIMTFKT